MILSFQHKGLREFFTTGSKRGIVPKHGPKLLTVLAALNVAERPEDLSLPHFRLHQLSGDRAGYWSIRVTGNWRVIFRFVARNVELVDYLDYH